MVSLGVAQYLVKPFTFGVFRERLEQYRGYRERAAEAAGTPTQSEIDALLGALPSLRPGCAAQGPVARDPRAVTADVRAHGPVSAVEGAGRLGMSRVAARRYLEHLAEAGRVSRSPRYGAPGRPESEYAWRDEA